MTAPMDMPCDGDDAEAIVAELEAFHRFAARVFDWPVGAEAAAALRGDLVVRQLRAAIEDTPYIEDLEEMLEERGFAVTDSDSVAAFVETNRPAIEAGFEAELGREPAPVIPFRREQPKVGRNAPCPCGSGRKFKKCCGR